MIPIQPKFLIVLCLVLMAFSVQSQIIGSSFNGQAASTEVKASEISAGGISGDVNVFSGTLNTDYSLGTVSTIDGLSFTARISHSSTFSAGDNMPHISGIPYGEGWNINVPTITVSVEDSTKFSDNEKKVIREKTGVTDIKTPQYSDAYIEGALYWYKAELNLPSASGRLVYKYSRKEYGNVIKHYFILSKFESYVEAVWNSDGNIWTVTTDDGTVYKLDVSVGSVRNPIGQRMQNSLVNSNSDRKVLQSLLMPKREFGTWYCSLISHNNKRGFIAFTYSDFGRFNFFEMEDQYSTAFNSQNINAPIEYGTGGSNKFGSVKDLYLKSIANNGTEKLDFEYKSIPTTDGSNLLKLDDPSVSRHDSLYSKKTIVQWNSTDFFDVNKGWTRYYHQKSSNLSPLTQGVAYNSALMPNSINPYVGSAFNPSLEGANIYSRDKLVAGETGNSGIGASFSLLQQVANVNVTAYKGGYLESNRISLSDMPQSDVYQIKSDIQGNDYSNLFDINIATGQSPAAAPDKYIGVDCYKKSRGNSIFSTFNHGLKWITRPYGNQTTFSNYFTMPNLPQEYDGINIQIGPANSDNKFALETTSGGRPPLANTYHNNDTDASAIKSGDDIPNSFGIGVPWNMLRGFYASKDPQSFPVATACFNECGGNNFWFNSLLLKQGTNGTYPSQPTAIDPSVKLQKVELIRYAKNPYMLSRVKKYVVSSDCQFVLVNVLALKHRITTTELYVSTRDKQAVISSPSQVQTKYKGMRNIVQLIQIKQLPNVESAKFDDYPTAPTVTFDYEKKNPNTSWGVAGVGTTAYAGVLLNSSIFVVSKITDPLGKETSFTYFPISDAEAYLTPANNSFYVGNDFVSIDKPTGQNSFLLQTYAYRYKDSELGASSSGGVTSCTIDERQRMVPFAYQVYMVVQKKQVKDNVGLREWNYTYQNFKAFPEEHPNMSLRFKSDYSTSYKVGFEKTTITGVASDVVEYTHLTDKFYWGKIKEIVSKDALGRFMSKSEIEWKSQLAFEAGIFRVSNPLYRRDIGVEDGDYFDYQEPSSRPNRLNLSASAYYYALKNYNTNFIGSDYSGRPDEYVSFSGGAIVKDAVLNYESRYGEFIGIQNPEYLNSYFVFKNKETNTQYDTYGNATQVVKEYDYYRADEKGKPSIESSAYQKLLGETKFSELSNRLLREPSWQLFSIKTYSPQQPDAYAIEENFYHYDLSNIFSSRIGRLMRREIPTLSPKKSLDATDQAYVKGMRNLPFEKRVTKKAWSELPIIQSMYYHYTAKERPIADFCNINGFTASNPNVPENDPGVPIFVYLESVAMQVKEAPTQPQLTLQFNASADDAPMTYTYPYTSVVTQRLGQYNGWAQPKEVTDIKGLKTVFVYDDKVGIVKSAQVGAGLTNAQTTSYFYRSDNKLNYALDPNGAKISYEYDTYGRMIKGFRNDVLLQEILQYSNFANDLTSNFATRAAQNFVETKTYLSDTEWWTGRGYVDPLGRKYAAVKEDVVVDNTFYDRYDRATIKTLPKAYTAANHSQLVDFSGTATNEAQIQYDAAPSNKILKTSKYGLDINGTKVVQNQNQFGSYFSLYLYAAWLGNHSDQDNYVAQPATNSSSMVTDEDGKKATEFSNALGQKIATASLVSSNSGWPSYAVTLFKYDSHGNVEAVSNPKSQVTTYEYNYLNQIHQKTDADGGSYAYAYNEYGQMVVEFNYELWNTYQARIFVYDDFGRMTKQMLVPIWNALYLDGHDGTAWVNDVSTFNDIYRDIIQDGGTTEKEWFYDDYDKSRTTLYANNVKHYLANSLAKTKGRLVQTVSYSKAGQAVDMRFFSYNNDGFMKWEMQQFNQNGIAADNENGNNRGRVIRIDYPKYNRQGGVLVQNVDLNGDRMLDMQYAYKYDNQGRLKEVYANANSAETNGMRVASFTYDLIFGTLKSKRHHQTFTAPKGVSPSLSLACKNRAVDVINYEYDLRRRLTQINSSSGLFSWQMFYDANNPAGSGANTSQNWNGNVNSTVATYNGSLMPGFSTATTYNFQYDMLNRLTSADAQAMDNNDGNLILGDESYSYDYVGNITSLLRGEKNGTTVQNVNYSYSYQNNKLTSVTDNLGNTRTMTYDATGNLMTDSKRGISNMVYGRSNLPTSFSVTKDGNTTNVGYLYSVNDNRIYKKTTNTEELNIEAGGKTIAVYDMVNNDIDWFVFGTERIAKLKYTPSGGWVFTASQANTLSTGTGSDPFATPLSTRSAVLMQTEFYLYDHLGNTRVTYKAKKEGLSCTAVLSYAVSYAADYYPYGKILREYKPNAKAERYLTTQHERDIESGLDYRGARFYDSDLGRFLSLDPKAATFSAWSPYNYVVGNPVIFIDPNGMSPTIYVDGEKVSDSEASYWGKQIGLYNKETKPNEGASWNPLTKPDLIVYAQSLGHTKVDTWSDTQLGDFFENIFYTWMTQSESTKEAAAYYKFSWNRSKMSDANTRNTVPDFTATGYYNGVPYAGWTIYEAKVGNIGTEVFLSSYKGQTQGHLDNMSEKFRAQIIDNVSKLMGPVSAPSVTYVTTGGVTIADSVRRDAAFKGLGFHHIVAQFKIESGQYRFHFGL